MIEGGYGPPLPAPIPAVQTTIAAIDEQDFHTFWQESDLAEIKDADEEGLYAPLLLDLLDLASWTSLFVLATTYRAKNVGRM